MGAAEATMSIDLFRVSGLVLAIVGVLIYRLCQVGRREKSLLPGPPTKPILGNLLDIPPRYAHLKFTEWSKTYGPVFSCKLLGSTMVVLNDAESVMELMDKRSGSSAGRPPSYINGELIASNNHPLLVDAHRSILVRKIFNTALAQRRVPDHLPLQHAEASATVRNIMNDPDNFYQELRRMSSSLALAITYGKRAPTYDGKDASGFSVKEFYDVAHAFNFFLEVGAAPPLDLLPILKYIPSAFASWKVEARTLRERMKHFYEDMLMGEVKTNMAKGDMSGCWMESILRREDTSDDMMKAWVGGAMMEAGSDTTSSVLLTIVLAAVLHPQAVAKAQGELDSLLGFQRSPRIEDMESLPYCRAFLLEVMRWRPILPAGVPHLTNKDETYNSMLIPAGAVLVENTLAILHDPNNYDQPEEFNPDRFMKHKFGLKENLPVDDRFRNTFVYGAGRRICLGLYFAENTLQIMLTKMLWAFTFERKIDPNTKESIYVPDNDFHPGHITAPNHFQCTIRSRNKIVARVIEEDFREQRPFLAQYEKSVLTK